MSCITKILELKGDKEFLACHSQSGKEFSNGMVDYQPLMPLTQCHLLT